MAKTPGTRALATFGLNVRRRREALDLSQLESPEKASVSWVTFLAKPGSLASKT
jgi:hypothetical protein